MYIEDDLLIYFGGLLHPFQAYCTYLQPTNDNNLDTLQEYLQNQKYL